MRCRYTLQHLFIVSNHAARNFIRQYSRATGLLPSSSTAGRQRKTEHVVGSMTECNMNWIDIYLCFVWYILLHCNSGAFRTKAAWMVRCSRWRIHQIEYSAIVPTKWYRFQSDMNLISSNSAEGSLSIIVNSPSQAIIDVDTLTNLFNCAMYPCVDRHALAHLFHWAMGIGRHTCTRNGFSTGSWSILLQPF